MYKNIVRYMTVGEPVLIGPRPKPEPEPEPELEPESESEQEPEPEPEPERGIPQEVLDKIYAEIEQIEQKSKLTEETLLDAKKLRDQADQLKQQAEKILAESHAEADKLTADTKRDADRLLEKVRKDGYDAGYKNGYDDGKQQGIDDGKTQIEAELADIIRQANDKAQKTLRDAKELTADYFIRAEDDIVKVVVMAIEKIIPQHFLKVPQVILPVVREAIKHVRDQKEIKIHVEPESYDLVIMARGELQAMLTDGTAVIEVISDEALKPGDCIIETPNGGVDARLSTQLGLMKSAVESVLNK